MVRRLGGFPCKYPLEPGVQIQTTNSGPCCTIKTPYMPMVMVPAGISVMVPRFMTIPAPKTGQTPVDRISWVGGTTEPRSGLWHETKTSGTPRFHRPNLSKGLWVLQPQEKCLNYQETMGSPNSPMRPGILMLTPNS